MYSNIAGCLDVWMAGTTTGKGFCFTCTLPVSIPTINLSFNRSFMIHGVITEKNNSGIITITYYQR